jgi:hypothetical protein
MAFLFRLETRDGRPADPPTLSVAVPNMRVGDVIPLGARSLRVVGKRDEDAEARPCSSSRIWPKGAVARRPEAREEAAGIITRRLSPVFGNRPPTSR